MGAALLESGYVTARRYLIDNSVVRCVLPLSHLQNLDRIMMDHWVVDLLLGIADWFLHLLTHIA